MGLEKYKEELESETYHDNPKLDKEKLHSDELCPDCGNKAEHFRNSEYRCTTPHDECEVLSFRSTDYEVSNGIL